LIGHLAGHAAVGNEFLIGDKLGPARQLGHHQCDALYDTLPLQNIAQGLMRLALSTLLRHIRL